MRGGVDSIAGSSVAMSVLDFAATSCGVYSKRNEFQELIIDLCCCKKKGGGRTLNNEPERFHFNVCG